MSGISRSGLQTLSDTDLQRTIRVQRAGAQRHALSERVHNFQAENLRETRTHWPEVKLGEQPDRDRSLTVEPEVVPIVNRVFDRFIVHILCDSVGSAFGYVLNRD